MFYLAVILLKLCKSVFFGLVLKAINTPQHNSPQLARRAAVNERPDTVCLPLPSRQMGKQGRSMICSAADVFSGCAGPLLTAEKTRRTWWSRWTQGTCFSGMTKTMGIAWTGCRIQD
jgi:hypothetical protein